MKYAVCCIRDSKAGIFGRPFCQTSEGTAIRTFAFETNRNADDNMMYYHPEDFTLYRLGTFDDETGEFDTRLPEVLVTGTNVKTISMEGVSHV